MRFHLSSAHISIRPINEVSRWYVLFCRSFDFCGGDIKFPFSKSPRVVRVEPSTTLPLEFNQEFNRHPSLLIPQHKLLFHSFHRSCTKPTPNRSYNNTTMISRLTLLSSCIVFAASLLIGSEGFTSVAPMNNQWGQQTTQHILSSSLLEDLDGTSTMKDTRQVSASPGSNFGKANADELLSLNKKTGIESEFPKRKIKASVRETGTDSMKYYIKSMCNHELLNKNEEIILAREIQILLKWEKEREKLEEELLR